MQHLCQQQQGGCPEMRLACRAARDAIDGRRRAAAARRARTMGAAVAVLARLAPRLHKLESLRVDAVEDYGCLARGPSLRSFGGLAGALEALPSPALLTRLDLCRIDADALARDAAGAQLLAAALGRFTVLRRLELGLTMKSDRHGNWRAYKTMPSRAAAALAPLRQLRALRQLVLSLDVAMASHDSEPPIYWHLPRNGADLLPWRQLEGLSLLADAAALAPLLARRDVAPQLTRLRALEIDLAPGGHSVSGNEEFVRPLAPLWGAPWLSQLTRLSFKRLVADSDHCRGFFEALPTESGGATAGEQLERLLAAEGIDLPPGAARDLGDGLAALLGEAALLSMIARAPQRGAAAPAAARPRRQAPLARIEELIIDGECRSVEDEHGFGGAGGVARLLRACNPATLRRLELVGFDDARPDIMARAADLVALTEVDLGQEGVWTYKAEGEPGAAAAAAASSSRSRSRSRSGGRSRAEQLARLRLRPRPRAAARARASGDDGDVDWDECYGDESGEDEGEAAGADEDESGDEDEDEDEDEDSSYMDNDDDDGSEDNEETSEGDEDESDE